MSTIKANTLLHSDGSTTTQPSIPALDTRMAKAWVSFNGSGTVAINKSFNISSITDIGTGKYRVNISPSMSDANYVWVGTAEKYTSWYPSVVQYDNSERTTTYIPVGISDAYGGAGWTDSAGVSIIIFSN
jgi:hypothetical protein